MYGNKEEMIKSIEIAQLLLEKTKKEVEECDTDDKGSLKYPLYIGGRVKRNCTVIRQLMLEVRKGCEWD